MDSLNTLLHIAKILVWSPIVVGLVVACGVSCYVLVAV